MILIILTGREAVFLRDRVDVLKLRLLAVKSKQCATKKNKYHCPEVFLDAVADKLTTTADLFLDAELLSKFYYIVSPWPLSQQGTFLDNICLHT
jgi:replication fork clamp-binding protein CrfC